MRFGEPSGARRGASFEAVPRRMPHKMRVCSKCGAQFGDDVNFCPHDATKLGGKPAAAQEVPVRGWTQALSAIAEMETPAAPPTPAAATPAEPAPVAAAPVPTPAPVESAPVDEGPPTETMAIVPTEDEHTRPTVS